MAIDSELNTSISDLEGLSRTYSLVNGVLNQKIKAGRFSGERSIDVGILSKTERTLAKSTLWNLAHLQGANSEAIQGTCSGLTALDLFCGAGGLSFGLAKAVEALGMSLSQSIGIDIDDSALEVFRKNIPNSKVFSLEVDSIIDYQTTSAKGSTEFAYLPEVIQQEISSLKGEVDIVMGGPPCQGHSNYNNLTRRDDLRNRLYLTVPAIGIALGAKAILIENVPTVTSDKSGVVDKAISVLEQFEYFVEPIVLKGIEVGVPQTRQRHFLLATKNKLPFNIKTISKILNIPAISAWQAIGDLEALRPESDFDVPSELSPENRQRIDYLFENDSYELPDKERPDCHKDGHTYQSVYGRIKPDQPSQTITGGFLSPGRGRYIHPTLRRGLTPHEGARLQAFPDSFKFERADGVTMLRKDYSKQIGDAVPPPMGFVMALAAISSL